LETLRDQYKFDGPTRQGKPAFKVWAKLEKKANNSQYTYPATIKHFTADAMIRLVIQVNTHTYMRWVAVEVDGSDHNTEKAQNKDALSILTAFDAITQKGPSHKILVIRAGLGHVCQDFVISYMVGMHVRDYFDRCIHEVAYGATCIPSMFALYLCKKSVKDVTIPPILAEAELAVACWTVPGPRLGVQVKKRGDPVKFCVSPHLNLVSMVHTTDATRSNAKSPSPSRWDESPFTTFPVRLPIRATDLKKLLADVLGKGETSTLSPKPGSKYPPPTSAELMSWPEKPVGRRNHPCSWMTSR